MRYKAIIFDMDGTIVDTEKIWLSMNKILIERRGIEFTRELEEEVNRRTYGLALRNSCAAIKQVANLSDPLHHLVQEGASIAFELYRNGIDFIDGFEDFYRHIGAYNFSKAIATNADDKTIETTDAILNLRKFFGKHIYGISAVDFTCKPDPAIYKHAASQLGVHPDECIAIEDSAFGIAAAQNAGMLCIGITTGCDRQAVKKADIIVNHYREIDIDTLVYGQAAVSS